MERDRERERETERMWRGIAALRETEVGVLKEKWVSGPRGAMVTEIYERLPIDLQTHCCNRGSRMMNWHTDKGSLQVTLPSHPPISPHPLTACLQPPRSSMQLHRGSNAALASPAPVRNADYTRTHVRRLSFSLRDFGVHIINGPLKCNPPGQCCGA